MVLWLVFCSILISLVCEALVREGYGAILAGKVAGWSMLVALICTQAPLILPGLDGLDHSHAARQTPDWTSFDKSLSNPITIKTTKERVTIATNPSDDKTTLEDEPNAKIDFMPTCGGGEARTANRLDLAKMNEASSDTHC